MSLALSLRQGTRGGSGVGVNGGEVMKIVRVAVEQTGQIASVRCSFASSQLGPTVHQYNLIINIYQIIPCRTSTGNLTRGAPVSWTHSVLYCTVRTSR